MKIICEYCHVIAHENDRLCSQCGAPLRPAERATVGQRLRHVFASTPDWSAGIDVSKWQGEMTWSIAKPKVDYAIIKASENTWEDSRYSENVAGCEDQEIVHGVYHFCRPSYDWRSQADFFIERIAGQVPPTADVERHGNLSKQALSNWIYSFVSRVQDATGADVMIYTRASFWDYYVAPSIWANSLPLWAAHYNAYITQPAIPHDWSTWHLWQWSADGNGKGPEYGAQSRSIDLNRFNGDTQAFYEWVGILPPPPPTPTDCAEFGVTVQVLNVRSGPGTEYGIVDKLYLGDRVVVADLGGQDVWIEIAPGKWCAHTYNGYQYLRKV